MDRKTKPAATDPKPINSLLETHQNPENPLSENNLLKQLTKAMLERTLNADMTHDLGHDRSKSVNNDAGNERNRIKTKTVQAEFGQLEIEVPRDREDSFEPQLIKKRQTRLRDMDTRIVNPYTRAGEHSRDSGAPRRDVRR